MTIIPPKIIWSPGISFKKIATHNGPIIVSNNIIRLMFVAIVYFVAIAKAAKDKGKMTMPEIDIAIILPFNILFRSINRNPTIPVIIAPNPVVPNAGILGFALRSTKYRPSDIAVIRPQKAPKNILLSGAFRTFFGSVTTIIIPSNEIREA